MRHLTVWSLLLLVPLAGAHAPSGGHGIDVAAADLDGCQPVQVAGLHEACLRPDGLYAFITVDGRIRLTHGPDPVPPAGDIGFDLDAEQRPPVCGEGYAIHVLYANPADKPDRSGQVEAEIRGALHRMNAVLDADAWESGRVHADYRFLCDDERQIRIDHFTGPPGEPTFDGVINEAVRAGFTSQETDFMIFYDGQETGICGWGNIWYDESPGEDNRNNEGDAYGLIYDGCWMGRTPMHENGHTQGAVQRLAPDSDLGGHCLEGIDVMCYPTSSILVFCNDRTHFDCDHDTYFDARPDEGEWLASNWNIGSRVNRFITFSDQDSDPVRVQPLETLVPGPAGGLGTTSEAAVHALPGPGLLALALVLVVARRR